MVSSLGITVIALLLTPAITQTTRKWNDHSGCGTTKSCWLGCPPVDLRRYEVYDEGSCIPDKATAGMAIKIYDQKQWEVDVWTKLNLKDGIILKNGGNDVITCLPNGDLVDFFFKQDNFLFCRKLVAAAKVGAEMDLVPLELGLYKSHNEPVKSLVNVTGKTICPLSELRVAFVDNPDPKNSYHEPSVSIDGNPLTAACIRSDEFLQMKKQDEKFYTRILEVKCKAGEWEITDGNGKSLLSSSGTIDIRCAKAEDTTVPPTTKTPHTTAKPRTTNNVWIERWLVWVLIVFGIGCFLGGVGIIILVIWFCKRHKKQKAKRAHNAASDEDEEESAREVDSPFLSSNSLDDLPQAGGSPASFTADLSMSRSTSNRSVRSTSEGGKRTKKGKKEKKGKREKKKGKKGIDSSKSSKRV